MKQPMIAAVLLAVSVPAYAQLGGLGGTLRRAEQVKNAADELTITDEEERKIGEEVSQKIRVRFGVVQDPAIHKYVTLLGTALAKNSERPNLNWTFVVLDTDGVNAFASPGGIVHVTRGALGLVRNEAELAGVLGHEIGHVVRKHTVNAIKKSKAVQIGTSAAARNTMLDQLANRAYEMVLENQFDRGDELDADKVGVALAQKTGYAGAGLAEFLARLDERNKGTTTTNGLFADHPKTKERIDKAKQQGGTTNAAVLVEARYKTNVKFEAKPIGALTSAPDAKGLSSASKPAVTQERQSAQVQASGGARGIGADRDAKGGDNPALVKASVSAAEVETFKKGIA